MPQRQPCVVWNSLQRRHQCGEKEQRHWRNRTKMSLLTRLSLENGKCAIPNVFALVSRSTGWTAYFLAQNNSDPVSRSNRNTARNMTSEINHLKFIRLLTCWTGDMDNGFGRCHIICHIFCVQFHVMPELQLEIQGSIIASTVIMGTKKSIWIKNGTLEDYDKKLNACRTLTRKLFPHCTYIDLKVENVEKDWKWRQQSWGNIVLWNLLWWG